MANNKCNTVMNNLNVIIHATTWQQVDKTTTSPSLEVCMNNGESNVDLTLVLERRGY